MKILFIHEGKKNDVGPNRILLIPMGLMAMADYLQRNGFDTKIIHLPIERHLHPNFDIIHWIKKYNAGLICLDLHWHQQSADVLELARVIKSKIRHIPVIMGGYTASFFYEEILKKYKFIDYIIRGDSEIPLLKLAKALLWKKNIAGIPNIAFRKDKIIHANQQTYQTGSKMFARLCFSNFNLLHNYQLYLADGIFEGRIAQVQKKNPRYEKINFFYNCGRGCFFNCAICGGSKRSQEIISNRKKISFAPPLAVVRELKNAKEHGANTWYNTFDPYRDRAYFIKLFKTIKKHKVSINLHFECQHLPSENFIDAALDTFKQITIEIVPMTGSDRLRKLLKEGYYSNEEILRILSYIEKTSIKINLSLLSGLPLEVREDIVETLKLINLIRNNYKTCRIVSSVLEIEPASAIFLDNEKYHIKSERKVFDDFIKAHRQKSTLGYTVKNFSKRSIFLIQKYYDIENKCLNNESFFLKKLKTGRYGKKKISQWRFFCRDCPRFADCF